MWFQDKLRVGFNQNLAVKFESFFHAIELLKTNEFDFSSKSIKKRF